MKKNILFSVFLLLGIVLIYNYYRNGVNRDTAYWGQVNHAKDVLEWIKLNENRYKERNGTYTKSLKELVIISESFEKEWSSIRGNLSTQPAIYPGLKPKQFYGGSAYYIPVYYYSIKFADSATFQAEARYVSFVRGRDDVWEITPNGNIDHVVSDKSFLEPSVWDKLILYAGLIFLLWALIILFFKKITSLF